MKQSFVETYIFWECCRQRINVKMICFLGAQSAVSSDSGVWTGGEGGGDGSPRMRRRPRNLEMVMRNSHCFHLRELQVSDLDIMGEFNFT